MPYNQELLPMPEGLIPLPPCETCGADICMHERVCPATDRPPGIAIDVPADGVMRTFVLDGAS